MLPTDSGSEALIKHLSITVLANIITARPLLHLQVLLWCQVSQYADRRSQVRKLRCFACLCAVGCPIEKTASGYQHHRSVSVAASRRAGLTNIDTTLCMQSGRRGGAVGSESRNRGERRGAEAGKDATVVSPSSSSSSFPSSFFIISCHRHHSSPCFMVFFHRRSLSSFFIIILHRHSSSPFFIAILHQNHPV